jgi:hypothetical protein
VVVGNSTNLDSYDHCVDSFSCLRDCFSGEKMMPKDVGIAPIDIFGKRYYVLMVHPRQAYLMSVSEAKVWYKDLMRQIRVLKYFER